MAFNHWDGQATDDPIHGEQEGRHFHGFYGHYCYLPLYTLCGEFLLGATGAAADVIAEIRVGPFCVAEVGPFWRASKATLVA